MVSPNSRAGQLESIYIILVSSIPLFWFCISNVGVVWGGGNLGIQNNYFSFNVFFMFLGPLDLLPWRVVGRSVGRSVCPSVNTSNSATNVWIFFKIGGNIPWVNISRRFFHFKKKSIFEFFIIFFSFKICLKVQFLNICFVFFFLFWHTSSLGWSSWAIKRCVQENCCKWVFGGLEN